MAVFTWGDAGARMTPEQIAAQKKVAQALMEKGMDFSPIQSPWQGAARVAQGLFGGLESAQADHAAAENAKADREMIAALLNGGSAPAAAPAPSDSAPASPSAAPMGDVQIPAGKDEFVSNLMPMAVEASKKTGVDPRIIVAQAAIESGFGKSAPGNNLFGIKSHGLPGGQTLPTTEIVDGQPVRTQDSFRSYASPADSVNGYADFILQNPRYKPMREAQGLDAQLAELGRSGYATDPQYGAKVGQIARSLPPVGGTQVASLNDGLNFPNTFDGVNIPVAERTTNDGLKYPNIYEPGPQKVEQPPVRTAQATSPAAPPATQPKINPALLSAITSPYASDSVKKIAGILLQSQLKEPTNDMREYDMAKRQGFTGTLLDYQTKLKEAGKPVTNINQQQESEFNKAAGKAQAERFDKIIQGGMDAQGMVGDLSALQEIGSRITTGKRAEIQAALGPYAEAMGVKIDGLDDLQAYKSIVSKLAPRMRVPGSGATSDYEMRQFLESLPSLGKTPGGNEIISNTLGAISQHKIAASEIASRAMTGEITPREAEKQLRALPDPMTLWRKSKGGANLKGGGTAPAVRKFNPATGRIE